MISRAIEKVLIEVECKKCHVRSQVWVTEIATDGPVTIFRGVDRAYCQCGGQEQTEFQVAITSDPVNRPVMKIVPAT